MTLSKAGASDPSTVAVSEVIRARMSSRAVVAMGSSMEPAGALTIRRN
jgi:hypothetical protein